MSNDNLKELWKEINQSTEDQPKFSEDQVKVLLEGKANDIFTKISKNLTIGMGLLGLYVLLVIYGLYKVNFSEDGLVEAMQLSSWYIGLDLVVDCSIIISFIYFFMSFRKLKTNSISGNKLKDTIKSAIKILTSYRRFFYYIVAVTVASGIVGFIIGAKYGISKAEKELGAKLTENPNTEIIMMVLLVLFGLIFFGVLIFIVWFVFKKLYGNYIEKLRDCYDELIETE